MHTINRGKYRILKSRNIAENKIKDIQGYDCYINDISHLNIARFLNKQNIALAPNLSYNPRACFLPQNSLADGSVALLIPKKNIKITEADLSYFSSKEFRNFYRIVKNLGTRSLNMDRNAVYFWGKKIINKK
jgi:DNA (cytosine-5)-methyltransferase 1